MTLDQIIASLSDAIERKGDFIVRFAFDPTSDHSFRGFYDELAFEPAENIPASGMLRGLKNARGQTFEGYKGGEYTMHGGVQVWIAWEGQNSDDMITPTLVRYWTEAS